MNTLVQDVTIPIYISLQYEKKFLKFPINPEELEKSIPSDSITEEIEGLGEISVPQTPKLSEITINSFFWQQVNLVPSYMYVQWLEEWQRSKKVAHLVVTRMNYTMDVTCEGFQWSTKAGEEQDIYFTLKLKEYREHKAKKLGMTTNKSLLQRVKDITSSLHSPILIDIPRATRQSWSKIVYYNPYIVKKNSSLVSITKTITGSSKNWKDLYDENKIIFGNSFSANRDIEEGTKLTLPRSWVDNKNYNIVDKLR